RPASRPCLWSRRAACAPSPWTTTRSKPRAIWGSASATELALGDRSVELRPPVGEKVVARGHRLVARDRGIDLDDSDFFPIMARAPEDLAAGRDDDRVSGEG